MNIIYRTIDKRLPNNIISIHRTHDQSELVEIYTAADIFVNPTREENFPTVNIESIACGTPVITFNTGGSPKMLDDSCGCVVEFEELSYLVKSINDICRSQKFKKEDCIKRSLQDSKDIKFDEYIQLYDSI